MHCNMQEGIKDGRRLRPGGLVLYRGPDARSHLKLQNIQASVNKDDCSGGRTVNVGFIRFKYVVLAKY